MQALGDKRGRARSRVVEYVADPEFLGSPFLVMERVAGRVPSDNPPFVISGWVHDAPPNPSAAPGRFHLGVRRHSSRRLAGARARRRRDAAPAARRWQPSSPGGSTISTGPPRAHRRPCCATRGHGAPENVPADEPEPALVLGRRSHPERGVRRRFPPACRARLGDGRRSARPSSTSAGILVIHGMTTALTGDLPGFRARADVLRAYESQLGRALHDLTWYETWAAFRSAAIMVRLTRLLHDLGLVPDLEMQERNPPIELLENRREIGSPDALHDRVAHRPRRPRGRIRHRRRGDGVCGRGRSGRLRRVLRHRPSRARHRSGWRAAVIMRSTRSSHCRSRPPRRRGCACRRTSWCCRTAIRS